MVSFGDFSSLCANVPSFPWCNLFYRQLQFTDSIILAPPSIAGVGINPVCDIPHLDPSSSQFGNIANVVLCGVSFFITLGLIVITWRRKAAVARIELLYLLICYAISLVFQLLTTSSFLEQGSTALVVLTAIHAGIVAALFWALLGNALVSMQVVEDGTLSSLISRFVVLYYYDAFCMKYGRYVICKGTDSRIDGSFIATLLETLAVIVLVAGWKNITEDSWEEEENDYYR
ncbi:hypothetical protein Clacol_007341 [Clathrus columnatus]|uniref:Chitin synthase export chaperone n=1 Tax=Clathrus columnatus TaxID=1419009 RepID=A0AAV5AJH6_9AGAM|nr:hypothetical protein Clacol_007341 [Clathrus columnatus]